MIYDKFQREAIEYIDQGHSVIVSAPTGAGKTAIAEHVIKTCMEKGVGVIYTAPIKALSNQKFRDFQHELGEHLGIITGDVSINSSAPVIIMTTEILRNKILDEPEHLQKYSWIIFDEIHYIDNPERGTVWEESLMFLPAHINILGLSATIPNILEFAAWVGMTIKRPVKTVIENNRPVPLHFRFQCQDRIIDDFNDLPKVRGEKQNRLSALINHLDRNKGFPVIYFVFGRKRAEELAFELLGHNLLNDDERRQISSLYASLLDRFELTHEKTAKDLYPLVARGIAYHHAGMLPILKEVVERLFTSRLIKVIFTTETFALGINMPSRSVIFDNLKKFYGRQTSFLKTRDFYQMAGRAGRRGIDTEGFVYCCVNLRYVPFQELRRIIYGKPEPVQSQFNTSYATVLNLYERHKEDLIKIYPLSLHSFQSNRGEKKEATRLINSKIEVLKKMGYIESGALTQKGVFAKSIYGYELILSELYRQGYLEELDKISLGILCAACVFEPRLNQRLPPLFGISRKIKNRCDIIYKEIKHVERRFNIYPLTKMPHFHLTDCLQAWMRQETFDRTLRLTDVDEGEIVRYFRMTAQIMREINDSKIASSALKEKVKAAMQLINRDVVNAEKQLRMG